MSKTKTSTRSSLLARTIIIVEGGVIQNIITEEKNHPVFIIIDHDNDPGDKQYTFPAERTDETRISSILAAEKNS